MWLCGSVAVYLCSYVAIWLCGYVAMYVAMWVTHGRIMAFLDTCWQHLLTFFGNFLAFFGDHEESSGRLGGAPGVMEGHLCGDFG